MLQTRSWILLRTVGAISRAHFSVAANSPIEANTPSTDVSDGRSDNEPNKTVDPFTQEFLANRIEVSPFQKILLAAGSSITSLLDPHRHDMIACLGETTGTDALQVILQTMKSTEEGRKLLTDKPRVNTKTIDMNRLRCLPENSFGRTYVKFLDDNKVTPDSRMEVRFIDDPELAYVMTRYRECHDLVHTILGMPTNMLGEVAVKWVEALNTGLPMCYGAAIFGAGRLRPKQRKEYVSRYLPWSLKVGKSIKPLMTVYWEIRWEQSVESLRNELGIPLLT